MSFIFAVIVVDPWPAVLANPPAVMVATLTSEDDQVTCAVRSSVVPSLKLPVAVNCCVPPSDMLVSLGATVMVSRVALVTVNIADPFSSPNSALMVAVPGATPATKPLVGDALLTVATEAGVEVQLTELVRFCVLPSPKVPTALNCVAVCSATDAVAGVTVTELRADDSTTNAALPLTEPCCAVMVAVPADWPVTWPKLLILAPFDAEELQVTTSVTIAVEPSLNVPVAT